MRGSKVIHNTKNIYITVIIHNSHTHIHCYVKEKQWEILFVTYFKSVKKADGSTSGTSTSSLSSASPP